MLTGDALLAKVREGRELTITEPIKPAPQEQSIARMNRETTITKEQLDELWNAIEYTLGTIERGNRFSISGKKDWCEVHLGRTEQSCAFLQQAKDLVNQLKGEL
jgi:hypothetical protein